MAWGGWGERAERSAHRAVGGTLPPCCISMGAATQSRDRLGAAAAHAPLNGRPRKRASAVHRGPGGRPWAHENWRGLVGHPGGRSIVDGSYFRGLALSFFTPDLFSFFFAYDDMAKAVWRPPAGARQSLAATKKTKKRRLRLRAMLFSMPIQPPRRARGVSSTHAGEVGRPALGMWAGVAPPRRRWDVWGVGMPRATGRVGCRWEGGQRQRGRPQLRLGGGTDGVGGGAEG